MNKNLLLTLVSTIIVFFIAGREDCYCQTKLSPGTPQWIAEGQTKWLLSKIKFDSSQYHTIYKVNLKYQILSDSIHKLKIEPEKKTSLYQAISNDKKDDFKMIFSNEVYHNYLNLLQSIKSQFPKK